MFLSSDEEHSLRTLRSMSASCDFFFLPGQGSKGARRLLGDAGSFSISERASTAFGLPPYGTVLCRAGLSYRVSWSCGESDEAGGRARVYSGLPSCSRIGSIATLA